MLRCAAELSLDWAAILDIVLGLVRPQRHYLLEIAHGPELPIPAHVVPGLIVKPMCLVQRRVPALIGWL